MGANTQPDEDETETPIAVHQETLGTENIAFVDTLNTEISEVLETADFDYEYILGDVSSYGVSGNGHAHFDLVHEDSKIHCVIFEYRLKSLDSNIEDGTHVAVKGDLSYYAENGSTSLLVDDVVEMGTGTYEQIYQENKRVLAEDGLLAEEAKQSLPVLPTRIGIVTSRDSDARTDAVTSIHSRYPDVDIVIQHSTVQGEEAMLSLMNAISALDDDATVDVIVVTRGGGADTDLRVFNETPLCRVIHNTETPVIVGVGHENDRTLADEVADRRVMTPTHVGEIVPEKEELERDVEATADRLESAYSRAVSTRLDEATAELEAAYTQHVDDELTALATNLDHAFETVAAERLTSLEHELTHALRSLEQQQSHKEEKQAVATAYERSQRRQRIAILLLALLVLGLIGYILLL